MANSGTGTHAQEELLYELLFVTRQRADGCLARMQAALQQVRSSSGCGRGRGGSASCEWASRQLAACPCPLGGLAQDAPLVRAASRPIPSV